MIVRKNDRSRDEIKASFHHFPRVCRCAIDRTPEKHLYIDNMMLIIQINAHKRLVSVASIKACRYCFTSAEHYRMVFSSNSARNWRRTSSLAVSSLATPAGPTPFVLRGQPPYRAQKHRGSHPTPARLPWRYASHIRLRAPGPAE